MSNLSIIRITSQTSIEMVAYQGQTFFPRSEAFSLLSLLPAGWAVAGSRYLSDLMVEAGGRDNLTITERPVRA